MILWHHICICVCYAWELAYIHFNHCLLNWNPGYHEFYFLYHCNSMPVIIRGYFFSQESIKWLNLWLKASFMLAEQSKGNLQSNLRENEWQRQQVWTPCWSQEILSASLLLDHHRSYHASLACLPAEILEYGNRDCFRGGSHRPLLWQAPPQGQNVHGADLVLEPPS